MCGPCPSHPPLIYTSPPLLQPTPCHPYYNLHLATPTTALPVMRPIYHWCAVLTRSPQASNPLYGWCARVCTCLPQALQVHKLNCSEWPTSPCFILALMLKLICSNGTTPPSTRMPPQSRFPAPLLVPLLLLLPLMPRHHIIILQFAAKDVQCAANGDVHPPLPCHAHTLKVLLHTQKYMYMYLHDHNAKNECYVIVVACGVCMHEQRNNRASQSTCARMKTMGTVVASKTIK